MGRGQIDPAGPERELADLVCVESEALAVVARLLRQLGGPVHERERLIRVAAKIFEEGETAICTWRGGEREQPVVRSLRPAVLAEREMCVAEGGERLHAARVVDDRPRERQRSFEVVQREE